MPLTNPIPGPPASVLAAALVDGQDFGPDYNQSGRATINANGPSFPDLPSLVTDVVSLTGSATFDLNMLLTEILVSQGWATQGVTPVTQNYTPLPTDAVILANAGGAALTITLPDATGPGYVPGQRYTIKKTDFSANTVTIATSAGQLIDGASSVTLTASNSETSVVFDGEATTNWWVWSGITSLTATQLQPTFSKTANYNAGVADLVICNITGGGFTVTLPSAPANGAAIGVRIVATNGTNTLTVTASGADVFDTPAGATSRTLGLLDQTNIWQYFAGPKIWYGLSSFLPVSGLDGRYITAATLTTLGDTLYENATPAPARLAGPTSGSVPYALTSTPSAGVAQAPAWSLLFDATTPAATSTTGATGSAATTPRRDHVHAQNYGGVFGDGSDGAVTLDGTTTFNSFSSLVGSTYTLTRDVYATNLTINNTVTLAPNGWRVFCAGTFTDNATAVVSVAGGAGAASGTAGASSGGQGTLGHGLGGGAGATGAGTAGNAVNGAGLNTAGTGGTGTSGAGGAGGTALSSGTSWFKTPFGVLGTIINVTGTNTPISGAPSGGGGGGDTANKGGGGGGGGGVIAILAWAIVHNGTYNVSGGAGGTPTAGNTGGGGGGSGGLILTYSLTAPTGSGTNNAAGGSAGSPHGSGTNNASAGGAGTVLNQVLS